jgi:ferrous iron transport protein B
MKNKKIALVGNPNSGKTTFFNALTGSNQYVGNWPGVTVEKKEGRLSFEGKEYDVIDLPGIYSLGAFSEDEVVAMDYILTDDADVIINVIDASNIERNLYLTAQLLEMGKNLVVALNMMDEAEKRELKFDLKALSESLGVPVIATVAHKGNGRKEILKAATRAIENKAVYANPLTYNENVTHHIEHMEEILQGHKLPFPLKWSAIKIIEGDSHVLDFLRKSNLTRTLLGRSNNFLNTTQATALSLKSWIPDMPLQIGLRTGPLQGPRLRLLPLRIRLTKF